jgi:putative membrane protein
VKFSDLPAVNASLNGLTAIILLAAYYFIRKKNTAAHAKCMLAAVTTSVIFLICYLTYHAKAGTTYFRNPSWFRPIYLTLLITHTILAASIVPLIIITLSRALRQRFDKHKKIARWTWPIWMYVSVTGVIIYYLLYIRYPQK